MSDARKVFDDALAAARRDGFEAGYEAGFAAGVEAMRALVAKVASPPVPEPHHRLGRPRGQSSRLSADHYIPVERGQNAELVEAALRSCAPRAVGPTELIYLVARAADGKTLPYTSVKHALNQLRARHAAREVSPRRWQHVPENERKTETPER